MRLIASALMATQVFAAATEFRWKNPCTGGPDWIRDAFVIRVDDTWYMTGTSRDGSGKTEKDQWPGFFLWSSNDLQTWKNLGPIITNDQVKWAERKFWAPEIRYHPTREKYFFCFNADQSTGDEKLNMGMGLAVADEVTGPYQLLTPEKPITNNNDASLFFDDDGKDYLVQTSFNLAPIDLDKLELTAPKTRVVKGGAPGAWDDATKINEGSCLLKINGTYYYFWSCNSWGYFVGYATAQSINGPWTKNPNNPIWGAAKPEFREKAGQPADLPFNEVGHGTPFTGPDNRLWIAGHGHMMNGTARHPYDSPRPCFDPLDLDPTTGRITGALSTTAQTLTFEPTSSPATLGSALQLPHRSGPDSPYDLKNH